MFEDYEDELEEEKDDVKVVEEEDDIVLEELLDEDEKDSEIADKDNNYSEQPEDSVTKRFKDKSKEEVLEAYKNLEKMSGEHSRELGELRKKVKEVNTEDVSINPQDKTIKGMKLKDLDLTIDHIDQKLAEDPLSETYKEDYLLRQKLAKQRDLLTMESIIKSTKSEQDNVKAFANFKERFKGLPEEIADTVYATAKTRFADDFGAVSQQDIETAFFMTNRELYDKNIKMETESKVRSDIAKAGKIASTPTMKASDTDRKASKTENWEALYNRDPDKAMKIARKLSDGDLTKLLKKVNK